MPKQLENTILSRCCQSAPLTTAAWLPNKWALDRRDPWAEHKSHKAYRGRGGEQWSQNYVFLIAAQWDGRSRNNEKSFSCLIKRVKWSSRFAMLRSDGEVTGKIISHRRISGSFLGEPVVFKSFTEALCYRHPSALGTACVICSLYPLRQLLSFNETSALIYICPPLFLPRRFYYKMPNPKMQHEGTQGWAKAAKRDTAQEPDERQKAEPNNITVCN